MYKIILQDKAEEAPAEAQDGEQPPGRRQNMF